MAQYKLLDPKRLVEEYYESTEQMNRILKDARTLQAAAERNKQVRHEFLQNIIGKKAYKIYDKSGLFAPVPLNALKLTFQDFIDLNPSFETPVEKVDKMITYLHDKYYPYKDMYHSENPETPIRTNIVFETIDDMINFFYNVLSAYIRTFRTEEINWKPIVKKFKAYLN